MSRPLTPVANIRRRTASQRQFTVRVISELRELTRGFRGQEQTLELGLLRARLLEAWMSPYYRELLRMHDLGIGDFRSFDDLRHFPITDRSTLGDAMAQMPASFTSTDELVAVRSSGTTGTPIRVLRDRYECLYMWTVLRFFCGLVNLNPPNRPRVVLLDSLPGGLEYSVRIPLFFDGALHRISLHRDEVVERLERVKPYAIFTDPAGLHWLGARRPSISPSIFLTSAQYFGDAQRCEFSAAYQAPIINYYATTETGPIAFECMVSRGEFHVLSPHIHVQVAAGEVLVTRLRPGAFPLIRYATGDRATLFRGRCVCGFEGATLCDFEGRRQCAFIREDGTTTDAWQLAWLFKHHTLASFRLTQTGVKSFELEGIETPSIVAELRAALGRVGFADARVTTSPELPHPSVKPEPFRCKVRPILGRAATSAPPASTERPRP